MFPLVCTDLCYRYQHRVLDQYLDFMVIIAQFFRTSLWLRLYIHMDLELFTTVTLCSNFLEGYRTHIVSRLVYIILLIELVTYSKLTINDVVHQVRGAQSENPWNSVFFYYGA